MYKLEASLFCTDDECMRKVRSANLFNGYATDNTIVYI